MKNLTNNLTTVIAIVALAFTTLLSGCEYEFIEPEFIPIPTQVSFTTDIMPIFNTSCNMSGCHAAGAASPDLSPANAYASLMQGSFIDTENPATSLLYTAMASGSMKTFSTPAQAALVLAWIEKGALNN